MHTSVREPRTLLDPEESLSTPFARDEQSLGVGVCWRLISMIFTANIPSDFMLLELSCYFSLTLTSSMSFGEYLNPGTTCTKLNRNGVNPRPAGLPLQHIVVQLCGTWLEHKIKFTQMWFRQNSQVKTERLEPS